jgi:hypothetical protein
MRTPSPLFDSILTILSFVSLAFVLLAHYYEFLEEFDVNRSFSAFYSRLMHSMNFLKYVRISDDNLA